MAVSNALRAALNQVGATSFATRAIESLANNRKLNVISSLDATYTLKASQSGAVVAFDRIAGVVYTLPAPEVGLYFDFAVLATVTSNAYRVNTNGAGVFVGGSLISIDTDTSNAVAAWTANGTSHVGVSSNGTTTGGVAGTQYRLTCVSPTRWLLSGFIHGTGVVATPVI